MKRLIKHTTGPETRGGEFTYPKLLLLKSFVKAKLGSLHQDSCSGPSKHANLCKYRTFEEYQSNIILIAGQNLLTIFQVKYQVVQVSGGFRFQAVHSLKVPELEHLEAYT